MSNAVPGWATAKVGEIMDLVNGAPFKPSDWSCDGLPIIRIQNLNRPLAPFNHFAGELSDKFRVTDGDLLFAWSGTPGTSFGAHIWSRGEAWLNQHIFRIDFDRSSLDCGYLRLAINQNLAGYIRQAHGGAGLAHITKGRFEESDLLVPPLNEQRRIVAKLDALFEKSRAIRDKLGRVPHLLANLKKSIYAAAISGRLSSDFRAGEGISTWSFERAEDVCEKVQSGSTPKAGFLSSGGVPFLKVYNIVKQVVDFDYRPQFISPEVHNDSLKRSVTLPGDVLMNIVGPPLGKVAIVPNGHHEWNINQAITLFRPSSRVTSGWLYIYLCAGTAIEAVIHETKGIVGQVNISLSQCRNFLVPVPRLAEQIYIQGVVESLLKKVESLANTNLQLLESLSSYEQSSLRKAFRGELVPQEPNDEPASILLERIRAERVAAGPSNRRTRTKKLTSST